MPDDAMTISERRKYLERMEGRYRRADRLDRGRLLDEMEAMTGLHRKSLLRLLGAGGLYSELYRTQLQSELGVTRREAV